MSLTGITLTDRSMIHNLFNSKIRVVQKKLIEQNIPNFQCHMTNYALF